MYATFVKSIRSLDLFYACLFLYFFTLHADQLNFQCVLYTVRVNNLLAFFLIGILLLRLKKNLLVEIEPMFAGALGLFTFSVVISLLASQFKWRCFFFLGMWGVTVLGYILLPYFLMLYFDVRRVLKLYFASFLCVGFYACMQLGLSVLGYIDPCVTQVISGSIYRPNAFSYEPSFYALYMTPFVVMASLHYWIGKKRDFLIFPQLSLRHIGLVYLFFLISTATTAIFSLMTLFLIGLLMAFKKISRPFARNYGVFLLYFGVAMLGISCVFPYIAKAYFYKFFTLHFSQHHSFYARWVGIANGVRLFLQFPLFGVGLGAMPAHFYHAWLSNNHNYIFFVEHEWFTDDVNPLKLFEPSNVATEILASLGLLGFFALFSFFAVLLYQMKKSLKGATLIEKEWIILFVTSVLITWFILQFNQGLFRTYIWVHFALAYGFMYRISQDKSKVLI